MPEAIPRVHPWQKPLPPLLYKYYPPERFHVLTDCMVRFSQREVFDDQRDLRPEVANFGTAQEIRAFMDNDPVLARYAPALKEAVIGHVLKRLIDNPSPMPPGLVVKSGSAVQRYGPFAPGSRPVPGSCTWTTTARASLADSIPSSRGLSSRGRISSTPLMMRLVSTC